MTQTLPHHKIKSQARPAQREPGLFEYFGTFPVWMLKIIELITPEFLIKKSPPAEDKKKQK